MVGIYDTNKAVEWDFMFKNCEMTSNNKKAKNQLSFNELTAEIGKVNVWYLPNYCNLMGFELFDRSGKPVYKSKIDKVFRHPDSRKIEIVLEEGERIIGVRSKSALPPLQDYAYHNSF